MDRRYLINARKTPRNPPLSIQMNNYFSVIRSFLLFIPCRANAHTRELFLSLESLFFALPSICFLFSLSLSFSFFFFSSRGGTSTKEHCYVKRSSTLLAPFFAVVFRVVCTPLLRYLSPPSYLFRFYRFTPSSTLDALSHSLSLPLLTVSSNPVSSKLCRILVRR